MARRRLAVRALAALLVWFGAVAGGPVAAAGAAGPVGVRGDRFVDGGGRPAFVLGASYEGPADRAWRMWEDDRFDPLLIDRDLERARAAGLTVLRVFVQRPLAEDLRAGRWSKLDRVLDLADRHGLRLVLTLGDYAEPDVAALAALDGAVARRYRARPTLFAYDLRNEPHLGDLALARFPAGVVPPLQDPAVVPALGEAIARRDVPAYRASAVGRQRVPRALTDDQAYVYANVLDAYPRFLADAQAWGGAHDAPAVAYLAAPEAAGWSPLLRALDATLAAWMAPRLAALRASDPERPVTLAHVDPFLASLPANAALDYRTFHRYPSPSPAGLAAALDLVDAVRAAVPGRPLVLGEFGFATAEVDEQTSAGLEAALVRGLRERGVAGALKWVLNDFPNPDNQREATLGLYRADGSPKPSVAAFRALAAEFGPPAVDRRPVRSAPPSVGTLRPVPRR